MVPKMCHIVPKICGMVPKICGMVPKIMLKSNNQESFETLSGKIILSQDPN